MRIRAIKPEFWRSEDISALDWETRLLFIGLWTYVDDNGVGRDRPTLIATDLFAYDIESDPTIFATVSRGLNRLSEEGRITRYVVDGQAYLHITNWSKHQKIDHPNKPRYPLPTCKDADIREGVENDPRESRESVSPGTGEQGNRGLKSSSTEVDALDIDAAESDPHERITAMFEEAWKHWLRKDNKPKARAKFVSLCRGKFRNHPEHLAKLIAEFGDAYGESKPTRSESAQFTPGLQTWLIGERWEEPLPTRHTSAALDWDNA